AITASHRFIAPPSSGPLVSGTAHQGHRGRQSGTTGGGSPGFGAKCAHGNGPGAISRRVIDRTRKVALDRRSDWISGGHYPPPAGVTSDRPSSSESGRVDDREELAPGADGLAVLLGHRLHDLTEVIQVVSDPGGQQLTEGHLSERRV